MAIVVSSILDIHAPVKKKKNVTLRPAAPWYSMEIKNLKKTSQEIGTAMAKDQTSSGSPVVY